MLPGLPALPPVTLPKAALPPAPAWLLPELAAAPLRPPPAPTAAPAPLAPALALGPRSRRLLSPSALHAPSKHDPNTTREPTRAHDHHFDLTMEASV
jgi:hypothetical protein